MEAVPKGFIVLLLAACVLLASASEVPWWNIKLAEQQGPNVCVVEEVPKTKHKVWTECKYWKPREICGQKPILRYECCEGYTRVPGKLGCTGVKPLRNVLETAKELGAKKFVQYIEESGLSKEFTRDGAITLFAPSDEAMQELTPEKKKLLERYKSDRQNPIVMYHTVDRRIISPNFRADLLLDTKYQGHKVRLNKFSSKIETVNCANILRKDHEATNGIVHLIDSVLDPTVSSPRNLADIIVQDGRFTQLARIMEQSRISSSLRRSEIPITILAPSDEAFQKLPKTVLSRIINNNNAREILIKNHIIPHTLCLPAVLGEHKLRTESNEKITIDCDKKGITTEGRKMTQQLTLGKNGVLYMVDDVLLPDRVKTLVQLVEDEKLYSFLQLLKLANLENTFDGYGDYTIFAPSDKAMLSLQPERLQELRRNKEEAKTFVLHHAVQGRIQTDNMGNNEVIMSLDEEHPLRFQVNRKFQSVDGSIIQIADREGLNGILHVIDKPLIPHTQSWRDLLVNNSSLSKFLQVMDQASEEVPEAIDMSGYKTLFVPTNQAFEQIGEQYRARLDSDTSYLVKVLRNHIADNMITSGSISPGLQYYMETKGNDVEVVKEKDKIKVNKASALQCDLMSKNGIIHIINEVLLPESHYKVVN